MADQSSGGLSGVDLQGTEDIIAVLQGMIDDLNALLLDENIMNTSFSPIFHKQINQHEGIRITGRFHTTDTSDFGRMSYITVNRSATVPVPWDGFGLAWRKGDGTEFNIYLVDNDAMSEEVMITWEQMFDQTGGINQFLMAGKKEILVDTWYQFQIDISTHLAMDVWIEPEDSFPETTTNENRFMHRGQTYPTYQRISHGNHFGVAVYQTQNKEWRYDDLRIQSIVENYVMQGFKMYADPSVFPANTPAAIKYIGAGIGDLETGKLNLHIRDKDNTEWIKLGSNTATGTEEAYDPGLQINAVLGNISDYRFTGNNYLHFLAAPNNILDTVHKTKTYYIGLSNIVEDGSHVGGATDIYLHDINYVLEGTFTSQILGDLSVDINNIEGIGGPILDIVSVQDNVSGIEFTPEGQNPDYVVVNMSPSTSYSTEDNWTLNFAAALNGVTIKVVYRYSGLVPTVQTTLDSDQYRYLAHSNLSKNNPLAIIGINGIVFKGSPTVEEVNDLIKTYINTLTSTNLERSDLIALMYTNGVTSVDTNFDLTVKEYLWNGTWSNIKIDQSYTLPNDTTVFFTDTLSIVGTIKNA